MKLLMTLIMVILFEMLIMRGSGLEGVMIHLHCSYIDFRWDDGFEVDHSVLLAIL
jgi:hypothetical protein